MRFLVLTVLVLGVAVLSVTGNGEDADICQNTNYYDECYEWLEDASTDETQVEACNDVWNFGFCMVDLIQNCSQAVKDEANTLAQYELMSFGCENKT